MVQPRTADSAVVDVRHQVDEEGEITITYLVRTVTGEIVETAPVGPDEMYQESRAAALVAIELRLLERLGRRLFVHCGWKPQAVADLVEALTKEILTELA